MRKFTFSRPNCADIRNTNAAAKKVATSIVVESLLCLDAQGCMKRHNGIVKVKMKAALRNNPRMDCPELLTMAQEQVNMRASEVLAILPPSQLLAGCPTMGSLSQQALLWTGA